MNEDEDLSMLPVIASSSTLPITYVSYFLCLSHLCQHLQNNAFQYICKKSFLK